MEWFFIWFFCTILGAAMLSRFNKAGTGFLLCLFLGPFGLLFVLLIRSGENKKEDQKRHDEQIKALTELKAVQESTKTQRECPFCAENILAKAKICKHCGKDVDPEEA